MKKIECKILGVGSEGLFLGLNMPMLKVAVKLFDGQIVDYSIIYNSDMHFSNHVYLLGMGEQECAEYLRKKVLNGNIFLLPNLVYKFVEDISEQQFNNALEDYASDLQIAC